MKAVWSSCLSFLFILLLFSACQKELSIENNNSQAKGSLKDSSGNCLTSSVHGTWYNGVTPGDTNYVDINVNVTQTGAYKISSDLQNGVFLSDSGTFTNTGMNTVRLKPSGVFFNHDATLFTFGFDSTTCTFTINVQDSTGTGLGGNNGGDTTSIALNTWKFTANGHVYSGDIIIASLVPTIGITLVINGSMQSGSTDTAFGISVQFPSSVDTNSYAGLYPTSDAGTNFLLAKFPSNDVIFAANAIEPEVINIKISSYDKNTKVMKGSFSGNSYDFTGNTVPITDGAFSAHLQ